MANTNKMKRAALGMFIAVSLVLLWFIVDNVRGLLLVTVQWNGASIVLTLIGALITLAPFAIALVMLYSIKADVSPFTMKNVKRLKAMALLLVIYGPYFLMSQAITQRLYPIVLADGSSVTVNSTVGGVVLTAGLVVYCVSLIFEYGISLQRQFDETL